MQCSKCRNEEIVFQPYSGQHLCHDHFIADFEAKAKRAIRVHRGMQPGDHIGVVFTGDSADHALLFFLQKLTVNRLDVRVSEIPVNGLLEEIMADAQTSGITRIALATPLENAATSALTAILRGDAKTCSEKSPSTSNGLSVISPFSHIPTKEVAIYARIHGLEGEREIPEQEEDSLFIDVKTLLADYSLHHPSAPHAVLNLCESLAACGGDAEKANTDPGLPADRAPNS